LFALPVPDGQRPMGVLELYRRTVGSLTAAEHASAAACAAAIARRMQSNWEKRVAQFDSAQKAIDAAATAGAASHEPADAFTRTQIHIAGGMVAIIIATAFLASELVSPKNEKICALVHFTGIRWFGGVARRALWWWRGWLLVPWFWCGHVYVSIVGGV
jgi:hypothetical protein